MKITAVVLLASPTTQPVSVEKMKKQYETWFDDVAARWLEPKPNPSL